ncbi:MAG: hypothetical protein HYT73_04810 [Candidatus Aenigmarchaeota archaeon]|nr:hypothetical protein [Candidatus Aenigmarchaeota archaeon]
MNGDIYAFFQFTLYKGHEVFVSPSVFCGLAEKLLPLDEAAFTEINSLIGDGGFVIGQSKFATEFEDIIVLAEALSITEPKKNVFVVTSKPDDFDVNRLTNENVGCFDIEAMIQLIKVSDTEFRRLVYIGASN